MQVTTIGLDIAKNVFQVHGIDAAEKVVVRKQLRRSQVLAFFKALPPCLIGMEACATAHCWARELTKLGHTVRLMPARDVKAYVKRPRSPPRSRIRRPSGRGAILQPGSGLCRGKIRPGANTGLHADETRRQRFEKRQHLAWPDGQVEIDRRMRYWGMQ